MKNQNLIILSLLVALSSCGDNSSQNHKKKPHLELQMTTEEYSKALKELKAEEVVAIDLPDADVLETAISIGEKLPVIMTHFKSAKSGGGSGERMALSTRESYKHAGIPIHRPSKYSPSLLKEQLLVSLRSMSPQLRAVILGEKEMSEEVTIEEFLKHSHILNFVYQYAARIKLLSPHMGYLKDAAMRDVRGYHYLTTNKIDSEILKDVSGLDPQKIDEISSALVKICLNAEEIKEECIEEIRAAEKNNQLSMIYNKYFPAAEVNWQSFFAIPREGIRKDVTWAEGTMTAPFNTPEEKYQEYFKSNVEDEFKWGDWKLEILFGDFPEGAKVHFKKGVTPHVDGLGGNNIYMDANDPVEEWGSQWTIRHEFGHVLGLPDCYHEFYDEIEGVFVNYQLDTTDLMCSRAGSMNERIRNELVKAYKR